MTPREFAATVGDVLRANGVRHFVTGSVASMWYGETRFTLDVDIVVDLNADVAEEIAARFPEPEFHCDAESLRRIARLGGSTNIIHVPSTVKADLIRASSMEFHRNAMERARPVEMISGRQVVISSPEDVIINKLLFHDEGRSDKHLRDIAGMLRAQGDRIDRAYIELWAQRFDLLIHWNTVLKRLETP